MEVWKNRPTIENLNKFCESCMVGHVGINFTRVEDDQLWGEMPVDQRTTQPFGIMHGGASCVLAETLGSVAAQFAVDTEQFHVVGQSINTHHIKSVRNGKVIGKASPVHLGKNSHIWRIDIENESGEMVSSTNLTMAIIKRKLK